MTTKRAKTVTALALLVTVGCASQKRELATWDEVGDQKTVRATEADRVKDPRAEAEKQRTAELCITRSEEIARDDVKKGWAIMEACLERDDLRTVAPFAEGARKEQIWKVDPQGRWLAKAIANRGAFLEGEKRSLAKHGVVLRTLPDAVDAPAGTVFVTRAKAYDGRAGAGQVVAEYSLSGDSKTEHHTEVVAENATHVLVAEWDEVKNRVESKPTGRKLILQGARLDGDQEALLLLKKTGSKKVFDEDEGRKVPYVVAEVVRRYEIKR